MHGYEYQYFKHYIYDIIQDTRFHCFTRITSVICLRREKQIAIVFIFPSQVVPKNIYILE